jgi:hypothetical protein
VPTIGPPDLQPVLAPSNAGPSQPASAGLPQTGRPELSDQPPRRQRGGFRGGRGGRGRGGFKMNAGNGSESPSQGSSAPPATI